MSTQDITKSFQDADSSDVDFLSKFLEDANRLPSVVESFRKQLELLQLEPGYKVLDVGCGIGDRSAEMAAIVSPAGKVCGTDLSSLMVEIATSRNKENGLSLEFKVASALDQPYPDNTFNCVRTERVLMYLPDPEPAVDEFIRVLKPGGRLAIMDFDWDALIFSHRDQALTRKIVDFISDSFPNGRVGVQLSRIFRMKGLSNVRVVPVSYLTSYELASRVCSGVLEAGVLSGVFDGDVISGWWSDIETEFMAGTNIISFQGFITCGTK